jgi:hypothetical protein
VHYPMQTVADTRRQTATEKPVVLSNLGNNDTSNGFSTSKMSPAGLEPTTYGLKVRCSTN